MQIFSQSRTRSSSPLKGGQVARGFKKPLKSAGFTLIELLISIGIIGLITGIVLTKYSSFDSSTLLKSLAYEIALSLREAQVKSVSVVRNSNVANDPDAFNYPYGVSFDPSSTERKKYTVFRYASPDTTVIPSYNGSSPSEELLTFDIGRSMFIQDVCVLVGVNETCSSGGLIDRLDISFRRPEFKALFYASETSGGGNLSTQIVSARIIVASANGGDEFQIIVTQFGQIMVKKN